MTARATGQTSLVLVAELAAAQPEDVQRALDDLRITPEAFARRLRLRRIGREMEEAGLRSAELVRRIRDTTDGDLPPVERRVRLLELHGAFDDVEAERRRLGDELAGEPREEPA